MNYKEALDYMQQIGQYGISPGLDSIRQLVGRLGNPQKGMRYVHVAAPMCRPRCSGADTGWGSTPPPPWWTNGRKSR